MVSYVDVLTILLILFIAVAARTVQPAMAAPAPPPQPAAAVAPAVQPPSSKPDPLRQLLAQKGLDLRREKWGLVISLPQTVLFPRGDERIPATALPMVEEITTVLRAIPNKVNLAGNADSVPIHNRRFHNNWELSAARGMALLDLLTNKYGIEESRLSVTSYGSYSPRDSNDSAEGRAANRRVEITILDEPN
jgi:chemotaxis protein MotB